MRYQVLNLTRPAFLGQECTGDVCRVPRPTPGFVAPPRSVTRKDALALANLLENVISNKPECFEGEDLTVAYALEGKLRSYGDVPPGSYVTMALMNLSEEEARVMSRAEACGRTTIPTVSDGALLPAPTQQTLSPSGTAASQPLPPGPPQFPIVPVAIGAGALGLIALVVSIVK